MGKYLKSLNKRGITAYLLKGNVVIDFPDDSVQAEMLAKVKNALSAIKAELLAEQDDSLDFDTRDNSPLMAAIRAKRKLAVCGTCGEVVEATEYPKPSEGWHFTDCDKCGHLGTVCLSELSEARQQIQAKLDQQGWCLMRSGVLGEPVIIVTASDIQTPKHLGKAVRYTLQEAACLRGSTKDAVEAVQRVKRVFGGEVER